jgi:hypothetical protein
MTTTPAPRGWPTRGQHEEVRVLRRNTQACGWKDAEVRRRKRREYMKAYRAYHRRRVVRVEVTPEERDAIREMREQQRHASKGEEW